jgi:hypothetical protein
MEQKTETSIRDHFTKFANSPAHQSCGAAFSWDFDDQHLIVTVVEKFELVKSSHSPVARPGLPSVSLPGKVVRDEVNLPCPVLRAISKVSGATQLWYSSARRLRVTVTISDEAREYLANCQGGTSFTFDRLLGLPTHEATRLLSHCLLVCVAKLTGKSKTVTTDGVNYRKVAAILLADSIPYRHFSPVSELRELVSPLIGG